MTFDRWQPAVIAHLARSKAQMYSWPSALDMALAAHPAPREHTRVRGEAQLSLVPDAEDGPLDYDEIGMVEFFLTCCKHAYMDMVGEPGSGDGPARRWFRMTLTDEVDETMPARAGRNRRAA